MIKKKIVYIFFLLNVFNAFVFSQPTDKEVHFSLGSIYNFNKNEFHEFWDPSMGMEFEFSFDHQFGDLGAGLTLMRFDKTANATLSFYSINYYFLFAKNFTIAKNFSLKLGFDFGLYEFRFDEYDDSEIPDVDVEREFAVKIVAGFGYRFVKGWSLELKTAYNHVYTKKEIDLFNLHLNVTKSFPMSDWLSEILE